jgi:hypothetical protein
LDCPQIESFKGAKHKDKEREKGEQKEKNLSQDSNDGDDKKGKEVKKRKKRSKEEKKKNGDGIKKPLSAYMLYTNHRRPVIKGEHACKAKGDLIL